MRPSRYPLLIALLAMLLSATPALAKNDKGIPPGHAKAGEFLTAPSRDVVVPRQDVVVKKAGGFSRSENAVVRDYFVTHPAPWTALPPGIAKNYARGKPLPPGIEKKVLPWGLMKRLPLRLGCEYAQVGRDVVLIDTATLLVVDVMKDVFS